ncbi:dnaJ homolog subfamily C member 1-like [Glandiceps talaboti]
MWLSLFILLYLSVFTSAWDSEELELFDLVEEVQRNFYEVLGLDSSASQADIRRAYRKLTLQFHPDKNKEEDAEEKFRQLVSVAEVLKDENKRKRYDEVLEHGLPDWRQPVFYYRRVRKMGLMELSAFLLVILTIGQYLVAWSIYLEKKLVLEEVLSKKKKHKKKKKDSKQASKNTESENQDDEYLEEMNAIPKPQITNLFPFKIYQFLVAAVVAAPGSFLQLKTSLQSLKSKEKEEGSDTDEEEIIQRPRKSLKDQFEKVEYKMSESSAPTVSYTATVNATPNPGGGAGDICKAQKGSEWTDDDISLLAKSMAKYPGGTAARWEKIAEDVGRTVPEVTKKAKEIKSSTYAISVDASTQGITGGVCEPILSKSGKQVENQDISKRVEEISLSRKPYSSDVNFKDFDNSEGDTEIRRRHKKPQRTAQRTVLISKTSVNDASDNSKNSESKGKEENKDTDDSSKGWAQNQQKLLEVSLSKFPKSTPERWDKIAASVPGKTKEECITRYKELVEMVRRKKQGQD